MNKILLTILLTCLVGFSQDLNKDGKVDNLDRNLMKTYIKTRNLDGDLNEDRRVNSKDLFIIIKSYKTEPNKPSVTFSITQPSSGNIRVVMTNISTSIDSFKIKYAIGEYPTIFTGTILADIERSSLSYDDTLTIGSAGLKYVNILFKDKKIWYSAYKDTITLTEVSDITAPIVGVFSTNMSTTSFNEIAFNITNSSSDDTEGFQRDIKIGNGSWQTFTNITNNTTTSDSISLWDHSYNIRDDSLFFRIRWYDEVLNYSDYVIDTIPKQINYISILSAGSEERHILDYIIVDFDTSSAGLDTVKYLMADVDTTLGGDSLKIIADTTLVGIRNISYIAIKLYGNDLSSDYGKAYRFPEPDPPIAVTSYLATAISTTGINIQANGFSAVPESIRVQYATDAYPTTRISGTNLYAGADTNAVNDDDFTGLSLSNGTTYYVNMWQMDLTNDWQTSGNENRDTIQTPAGEGGAISDDYSSDTSTDYTVIAGGFTIGSGVISADGTWAEDIFYHETATGSNDHYVEADISSTSTSAYSGLIWRCNGTTGYILYIDPVGDRVTVDSFNGSTDTFLWRIDCSADLLVDTVYRTRVEMSGTTISVYIDLNDDGDFLDTNESLGSNTDATYSTGQYIGFWFNSAGTLRTADNLEGDAL